MRNGMSVREIYERLDRFDRLEAAADRNRRKYEYLKNKVRTAIRAIENTMRTYAACYDDPALDEHDRFELYGRIKGLTEAKGILRGVLEDDAVD